MLNVGIQELINVNSTTGATTVKTADLTAMMAPVVAWNAAHPTQKYRVHVRLHVGERAPDAWRTLCGQVKVGDNNFDKLAWVPRWWLPTSPYRTVYTAAMAALGPALESFPDIKSVNNPAMAYFYPEPFLMFPGSEIDDAGTTNADSLHAAGWTLANHKAYWRWAAESMAPHFDRLVVYLAINPTKFPDSVATEVAFMWEIADLHIDSLPVGRAGVENYSMGTDSTGGGTYLDMYNAMATRKNRAWISAQLRRAHKIDGPIPPTGDGAPMTNSVFDDLGAWWEAKGGHAVETSGDNPAGAANVWPTAYASFEATLTAQQTLYAANVAATKTAMGG